jgi:hypothetical protein
MGFWAGVDHEMIPESHHTLTAWPTGQMLSLAFCTFRGLFRIRWCSPAMLRSLASLRQSVRTITSECACLENRASSSHRLEAAHRLQLLDLPLIYLELLSKCKQLIAPPLTLLEAVEVCGRLQRNVNMAWLPQVRMSCQRVGMHHNAQGHTWDEVRYWSPLAWHGRQCLQLPPRRRRQPLCPPHLSSCAAPGALQQPCRRHVLTLVHPHHYAVQHCTAAASI